MKLLLFLLAFAVIALYLTLNTEYNIPISQNIVIYKHQETLAKNGTIRTCDFFSGSWVYDDVSYPLYKEGKCGFINKTYEFTCEKNGRSYIKYQHWRWQPHHCDLPRFDGAALLDKLRDKKLVFVGDSIGRNQWESLLCLIEPYLPLSTNKKLYIKGNFLNFHVQSYNTTISSYWSPFLVESNRDELFNHSNNIKRKPQVRSIEKHGKHWINADVLIFDTFAWWNPELTLERPFDSRDSLHKNFEIGLNTWADWLEYYVDRHKTKIFYTSFSPYPLGTCGSCYNEMEPIFNETCWREIPKLMMKIVESTIEKLEERGVKIEYLNITQLSSYREDAHPSVYTKHWENVDVKLRNPYKSIDCKHWCLPGVPDVWNQIFYALFMKP